METSTNVLFTSPPQITLFPGSNNQENWRVFDFLAESKQRFSVGPPRGGQLVLEFGTDFVSVTGVEEAQRLVSALNSWRDSIIHDMQSLHVERRPETQQLWEDLRQHQLEQARSKLEELTGRRVNPEGEIDG